jgi:hypothetical protein
VGLVGLVGLVAAMLIGGAIYDPKFMNGLAGVFRFVLAILTCPSLS